MAKVKICDAMMGSGKTSAAIKMINERVDKTFLFITPYLNECDRIKERCKRRKLLAPWRSDKSKFENLHELLGERRNLASTHAMMRKFNDKTVQLIKEGHYVLVLDEVFDVLNVSDLPRLDIKMLGELGAIAIDSEGAVSWKYAPYEGDGMFSDFKKMCDDGLVVASSDDVLIWQFPVSVFEAFDEVIILTYQFDGQIQRAYFDMNGVDYEYIGVRQAASGEYEFCAREDQVEADPHYERLIHIVDDRKLNELGDLRTAFSINWTQREAVNHPENLAQVRRNLENIRRRKWHNEKKSILWTCAKENLNYFDSDRITEQYLSWNYRATNDYRERRHLFYLHNVFLNPNILLYLHRRGVDIREDQYALTSLVQWIWRSAIRENHEIWLYIPSARMRGLLKGWLGIELDSVEAAAVRGRAS